MSGTRVHADRSMQAVQIGRDGTVIQFKDSQKYHLAYEREGTILYHGLNDQPFPIMLPAPYEHVLLRGPSIVIVGATPEGLNQAAKQHLDSAKRMAQHFKGAFELRTNSGSKSAASKMAAKRHSSVINKALMRRRTSGGRGGDGGGAAAVQAPDAIAAIDVAQEEEQLEEEEGMEEEEEDEIYEEAEEEEEEEEVPEEDDILEEDDDAVVADEEDIEE